MKFDHTQAADFSDAASPLSIDVQGYDVTGAIFVVPADAPLPNELQGASSTGTFYQRLAPLASEATDRALAVVPISSTELLAISQAWRHLVKAKKVLVLKEIPGAKYDVIFTSSARTIGLQDVDWAQVVDAVSRRSAAAQATRDSKPWSMGESPAAQPSKLANPWATGSSAPLASPTDSGEDVTS